MNIHEYQAKEILRAHGVPVPPGEVATTPEEAVEIASRYGGEVVIKAGEKIAAGTTVEIIVGMSPEEPVAAAVNSYDGRQISEVLIHEPPRTTRRAKSSGA